MSFEWTTAHTAILTDLCAEGLSAREIAVRLGGDVTRNSVIGRVHRLGLQLEKKPGGHRVKLEAKPEKKKRVSRKSWVESESGPKPITIPETSMIGLRTPMIEASFHVCRYPLWEADGAPDYPVCGLPGHPWCEHHRAVVFGRGTQMERSAVRTAESVAKTEGVAA